MWTDNEGELLLHMTLECKVNKMQETPSDAPRPQCSGREDVDSDTLMAAFYLLLLRR